MGLVLPTVQSAGQHDKVKAMGAYSSHWSQHSQEAENEEDMMLSAPLLHFTYTAPDPSQGLYCLQ